MYRLRDYQDEAILEIAKAREKGVMRQLVCLSTGLGKTVLFASLPARLHLAPTDVTLVIAHRDELINQAAKKLAAVNPEAVVGKEKAAERAHSGCSIVAASIQTLVNDRLQEVMQRFDGRIALLVIDEAHRATSPSYRRLIQAVTAARPDALVIGVTATPNRPDKVGLREVFDRMVIHKSAQWAIEQGYLVPLKCFQVRTDTSLEGVHIVDGDFDKKELAERVDTLDRNNLIVSAYQQHTPGKKAIVFCTSVEHAYHLTEVFRLRGIAAATANGKTPKAEREEILEQFKCGALRVLVNVGLYYEGLDVPDTEVVILARPTQSGIIYSQAVGRILRPLDTIAHQLGLDSTAESRKAAIAASAKPFGIVLDVVDQTAKHSLMSLPTLWGMPPHVNAQGRSILQVRRKYEELHEIAPTLAQEATSFEEIVTRLQQISPFRLIPIDATVSKVARMIWGQISDGTYRLSLPIRTVAKDRMGLPIKNFRQQFLREMSAARQRGVTSPKPVVYEILNVDPESVVDIHEHLELRQNLLGAYEVYLVTNGDERLLGQRDELPAAFRQAERWVENNRKDAAGVLRVDARWRNEEVAPGQRDMLKRLAVPDDMIPKNKGDASRLIAQLTRKG